MAYEPQRIVDVVAAFASKKQTALATALADADINKRVRVLSADVGKLSKAWHSDLDRMNKPDEWASELTKLTEDVRRAYSADLDTTLAGIISGFCLGKTATSQPDAVGAPTAYQHILTFSDPSVSKQVPVTTVAEQVTADIKRKLVGMAVNDFTISGRGGPDAGPMALAANIIGIGKVDTGVPASFPVLTTVERLYNKDVDILLGTEGAPTSIKDRVIEWSVTVTQNLLADQGYHPGSGLHRGYIWHGRREVGFSLRLFAKETDDILTLFEGTAPKELQITVEGSVIGAAVKHKLDIRIPAFRMPTLDDGEEAGMKTWIIDVGTEGIFKGSTLTEPIQITVINEDSALLT